MTVFVWQNVTVSDHYHSEGGLLVIADTERRARELAYKTPNVDVGNDQPAYAWPLAGDADELVLTFPDAGCC